MPNHKMMLQFSTTVMKTLIILCLLPGELLSDDVASLEHNIDIADTKFIRHDNRINKRSPILNEPTILVLGKMLRIQESAKQLRFIATWICHLMPNLCSSNGPLVAPF